MKIQPLQAMSCGRVLFATLLAAALSSPLHAHGEASLQPPDWDAPLRLADIADRNPDPHIVEVDL